MKFLFTRRGSIVTAVWFTLALQALALFLFVFLSAGWWVFGAAGALALPCYLLFPLRARHGRIVLRERELYVRRGHYYLIIRRLPRSGITAVSLWASPLQRLLGVCCLVVQAAGASVVLFGILRADAETLQQQLLGEKTP